jgi:hypothetical protein
MRTVFAMLAGAMLIGPSATALAEDHPYPDYLDDKSTAAALIESYYNAINRQEYARAYTYWDSDSSQGSYKKFAKGYEDTAYVEVMVGDVTEDAGMSKVYSAVPVAIDAEDSDGKHKQFAGCYTVLFVQPSVVEPPYYGMVIEKGSLKAAKGDLEDILPDECDQ